MSDDNSAGSTIPQLPVATQVTDGDLFVMVDVTATPGFQTSQISAPLVGAYAASKFGAGAGPMPAGSVIIGQGTSVPPLTKAISNDATLAASGALTLANIGTPGTVGSSTSIPTFTTDYAGRITSYSGNAVIAPAGTLTGTALAANIVSASLTTLSSLTTVGTIGTGVWQATPIALAFGGTNANLTATVGGIFYSTASAAAILAGTATARQMLQSGTSGAPAWSTAVWPATTTINQLLYSSVANTVAGLATGNGGVLNTSATGVPSVTPSPVLGLNGSAGGSITLEGATSGSAVIGVPAAAGSAVPFNLPSTLGSNGNVLTTDGAGNWSPQASSGGGGALPQGRLTLTSLTPVLLASVSAAATVIYTPYQGNNIPLWNGSSFVSTVFPELTNVLANSATGNAGPAAAIASSVYDFFIWSNAGTPTLTRGGAWNGGSSLTAGSGVGVTMPTASPGVVGWTAHGFAANQIVAFNPQTGTLPAALTASVPVFVSATGLTANSFQVSNTLGGASLNFASGTATTIFGIPTISLPLASPGIVNWPAHALSAGTKVVFNTTTPSGGFTNSLPTGVTGGTSYFVLPTGLTANAFEISLTAGGSAVNFTGTASKGSIAATSALIRAASQGLSLVNGVNVNATAITNGPGAGAGTFVATAFTDSGGGTVSWSLGGSASGGTAATLNLWNAYNRVNVGAVVTDSGTGYTYTTGTNRQARASTGNQIGFVLGLQEDAVQAALSGEVSLVGATTSIAKFGLGLDSITAFGSQPFVAKDVAAVAGDAGGTISYVWNAAIGSHVISSQEIGDGTNANTFDNSSLNALSAILRM